MRAKFVNRNFRTPFATNSAPRNNQRTEKYPLSKIQYENSDDPEEDTEKDKNNDKDMERELVGESIYEFAKKGSNISEPDSWDDVDDVEDKDIDDIDISDMEDVEEIEIEDELINALKNEIKIPEFNRRALKFKLKGDLKGSYYGIPMAQLKDTAFLFKIDDGSLKKINLKDMIVEELKNKHTKYDRAIFINEENEDFDYDAYDDEFGPPDEPYTFILKDGTNIEMIEDTIRGMAGESEIIRYFIDENGNQYWFKDIENKLEPEDREEIETILKSDEEENYMSAKHWTR